MENLIVDLLVNEGKKSVKFTFLERLTEENARLAVEQWRKMFLLYPDEKIILIWDCLKMTGYDPGARNHWQTALKELKDQIACVWLITDSSIIKMGASVMSMFASYKIQIVKTEKEIIF